MRLSYSKRSQKDLKKIPQKKIKSIVSKIFLLQKNPHMGKKLKGEYQGLNSLRIWPYRVIYKTNKLQRKIIVITIEHRQGVYK